MRGELVVCPSTTALADKAAELVVGTYREAVEARGRFVMALAGGRTPVGLYERLGAPPVRDQIDWSAVHALWGDERLVPAEHAASNFGVAWRGFLESVPIPDDQVHRVPTERGAEAAAEAYSELLTELLGGEGIDLVVLGMGADGHVASLFPGTQTLYEDRRGAVAQWVPGLDAWRVTVTMAEINRARHVLVLVQGAEKAAALSDVRTGVSGVPAARVAPAGTLTWLVDRAAVGAPDRDVLKRRAAEAAVEEVRSGMVVGLGTGSTARFALEELAARLQAGALVDVTGIATSKDTARHAAALSIPLGDLGDHPEVDLTIDGADEIGASLTLIKGGGGALLREKIVAAASREMVVIADETKLVDCLGRAFPLPVEVVPFGWTTHLDAVAELGAEPVLRLDGAEPCVTDSGHFILDCRFGRGIDDPAAVHEALARRPGVVETGLFIGVARCAIVGTSDGLRRIEAALPPGLTGGPSQRPHPTTPAPAPPTSP